MDIEQIGGTCFVIVSNIEAPGKKSSNYERLEVKVVISRIFLQTFFQFFLTEKKCQMTKF